MNQNLLNLLLALITNTLILNSAEVYNMRGKVKRLAAYIAGKPYKELPVNIDTRVKSYGISLTFFLVMVLPLWGLFTLLGLSGNTALWYGIIVLLITYISTMVHIDRFHVEIERVTRPFMKKK